MKSRTKRITDLLKRDNGLVVVEATIVFPVMFFVLFFLIFFGNALYVKAVVTDYVVEASIKGAAYVADPFLEGVKASGEADNSVKIEPYRYIFLSKMDTVTSKIKQELKNNINGNAGFFSGMAPTITSEDGNICKFNNQVLYSTFIVEVTYNINFPWHFLGSNQPTILSLKSRAEAPVGDVAEFIRNTDMILDMLEGNKVFNTMEDAFGKVKDFFTQFNEL